ncbi:hypothetical protein KJ903_01295 [Patescibacteria group bacterium]|nr:hypothetical protein [Patescibacteria group bacterium]
MPKCKDCKFFKTKEEDAAKGDCFGHEVDAELDTDQCPTKSFEPKEEDSK